MLDDKRERERLLERQKFIEEHGITPEDNEEIQRKVRKVRREREIAELFESVKECDKKIEGYNRRLAQLDVQIYRQKQLELLAQKVAQESELIQLQKQSVQIDKKSKERLDKAVLELVEAKKMLVELQTKDSELSQAQKNELIQKLNEKLKRGDSSNV